MGILLIVGRAAFFLLFSRGAVARWLPILHCNAERDLHGVSPDGTAAIEKPHPPSSQGRERRRPTHEQSIEPVREMEHGRVCAAAGPLIGTQRRQIARMFATKQRIFDNRAQRVSVGKPQVNALSGQGVYAVGSVANERDTGSDVAHGVLRAQRKRRARSSDLESTKNAVTGVG